MSMSGSRTPFPDHYCMQKTGTIFGRILRGVIALLAVSALLLTLFIYFFVTNMPGSSYAGPFRPLTEAERQVSNHLERHIRTLAGHIGERNVWRPGSMESTADYIRQVLVGYGYEVASHEFETYGRTVSNLEAVLPGATRPEGIVVVGAHYDTVLNSPGANDNGSGIAGVLELARLFAGRRFPQTVRLVFFANEEAPFFYTSDMGSQRYARQARARGEKITAMLALETLGFYTEAGNSQQYPFPFSFFYPDQGNFIAFVGNLGSRNLVRQAIGLFRETTPFPSEGTAAPGWIAGVGWSDHRSFWQEGYPAIMLTDTAVFRYPHYHTPHDLPEHIDYGRLARVIMGIGMVVAGLAEDGGG
jgi:hypothetical protein